MTQIFRYNTTRMLFARVIFQSVVRLQEVAISELLLLSTAVPGPKGKTPGSGEFVQPCATTLEPEID